ncbi:MAG: hypothetical protein C4291_00090 [Candidatus Dadabacteria bacterium]
MKTRLRGVEFKVNPEEVKKATKDISEGWGRKYAVDIEGRYYPPKEVIFNLLRMKFKNSNETFTRMDFTTMDAVRILRRLGFKTVGEEKKRPPKKKKLSSLAGTLSLGGDSIKDSEPYYE